MSEVRYLVKDLQEVSSWCMYLASDALQWTHRETAGRFLPADAVRILATRAEHGWILQLEVADDD